MTTAKGKHLIEALLSSRVPRVALPDDLYNAFPHVLVDEPSEAVAHGLLVVSPQVSGERHGRLRRSEVGVLHRSLMEQFGLYEAILDFVVQELTPRCPSCGTLAERPVSLRSLGLPESGFVVACELEDSSNVSLKDRCELLGAERAVVGGHLVRADSLQDEEGESIIAVAAVQDRAHFDREVERWFSRGGGDVRVLHFADRAGSGMELLRCSRSWRCATCRSPFEAPSRQTLNEAVPCPTCRGAGWLAVEGERLAACRDCGGFGSLDVCRRFDFGGVELQHVASLTFAELLQRVKARSDADANGELAERLRVVCESGFSEYPIGAALDLLSQGERTLVSITVGKLSKLDGVLYVVDGAVVRGERAEEMSPSAYADVRVVIPVTPPIAAVHSKLGNKESIVLQDIVRGPLRIAEVAFPVGALSAIQGAIGVGKSLLLATVAERFSKRRTFAHNSTFASLKRCHRLPIENDRDGVVLDLLGLSTEFAAEIARTKEAKRAGILGQDLVLPHSLYRCGECAGVGQGSEGEPCGACGGDLFDWRVADIQVAGVTVGRALQMTIRELGDLFWASDRLSYVFKRFPGQYGAELRLHTPSRTLSPEIRRFLRVWGGLVGVLSGQRTAKPGALAGDLVLLDAPGPQLEAHLAEIGGLLSEVCGAGATVIYAGMPESLESQCACVVRLALSAFGRDVREVEEFLDTRYSRTVSVS